MPAYEYVCNDCQKDFMIFLSLKEYDEKSKIKCAHCGSNNVQRKFTGFFAKTSKKS
ncbi:MAG TPA: FmdB family transcriptional regulator [Nitrospiraceae bacterium]|nr:FmdB family transcriptional regulator [Nitrospiraceae bacterium]